MPRRRSSSLASSSEQFPGFLVGLGGGDENHLHAADLFDLVVLDLGEDELLFQTEGVVASAVESVGIDALEVAHSRKSEREELIHELVQDEGAWLNMIGEGATRTFEMWSKDYKWNTSLFHLTLSYAAIFLADIDQIGRASCRERVYDHV